jgi:creatinine amidohydrolase
MEQKLFYVPEMRIDEVKEAIEKQAILLVPIATVEQHGLHAPYQTDIDNVHHMCLEVAKRLNPDPRLLVAPPIWFSPSPHNVETHPCCIRMRKEVYMDVLTDIFETYLRSGFKRIIVINGHGGGTEKMIPQAIRRANWAKSEMWPEWQKPKDARIFGFTWISFLAQFARDELMKIRKSPLGSDWHAGDIETSLQLHLHPDLVDMKKAKKGIMNIPSKFAPSDFANYNLLFIMHGYYADNDEEELEASYNEVGGDPTLASRELGEKIFKLAVKKIVEFIQEVASRTKAGGFK